MEVRDEVCGMELQADQVAARTRLDGKEYYFCSERCKRKFEEHPGWYVPVGSDVKRD